MSHQQFCEMAALDAAWEHAIEAGLVRMMAATRTDPACPAEDVEILTVEETEDGYRVRCGVHGRLTYDATWQVEGGFGDDGRSGRPVLQEIHFEDGGPDE